MVESEPVDAPKKGKKDRKAGHLRMVVIEDLGADTVKEAVNDICEKESTEVIMDDSTAHVKVGEVVEKAEACVVNPKKGTRCFLGYIRPYPMQKQCSLTCTTESNGNSCNSILMNFVISSIVDTSENGCPID